MVGVEGVKVIKINGNIIDFCMRSLAIYRFVLYTIEKLRWIKEVGLPHTPLVA
jgi:hypothetical protein